MLLEVRVGDKFLATLVTREGLVASVKPLVDGQGTALGKHLATQRALVPPLPCVGAIVRLHVLLIREALVAVVARVRFFPSMDACVALQCRCRGEALIAHGACIWPLPSMCPHVDLQL